MNKDMSFASALVAIKNGYKVARQGWNGKGMFLLHIEPYNYSVKVPIIDGEIVPLEGFVGMKTAKGTFVPWQASQADMLADDWVFVE